MSVDTNTTNKNLAPYSRIRHPEYRITTKGRFVKNLVVELSDEGHRPVYAGGDDCC